MSVKKTSSPLSSGSESLEPLVAKDKAQGSAKIDKSFEAALAEVANEIEQADGAAQTESTVRSEFQRIASQSNLDSNEGAFSAVRESARFLVNSRLKDNMRESAQGKKINEDLSEFIAKDPFMHRKILNILRRLK